MTPQELSLLLAAPGGVLVGAVGARAIEPTLAAWVAIAVGAAWGGLGLLAHRQVWTEVDRA